MSKQCIKPPDMTLNGYRFSYRQVPYDDRYLWIERCNTGYHKFSHPIMIIRRNDMLHFGIVTLAHFIFSSFDYDYYGRFLEAFEDKINKYDKWLDNNPDGRINGPKLASMSPFFVSRKL